MAKLPIEVAGRTVRRLMAQHRVTIREIAACYGLTLTRIREVRLRGGPFDWPLIIEGTAKRKVDGTVPTTFRGGLTYPKNNHRCLGAVCNG